MEHVHGWAPDGPGETDGRGGGGELSTRGNLTSRDL